MVYLTHKITISNNLNTENFDALKRNESTEGDRKNLATCALGNSLIHQQWHSPSSWNIKRDFY